MMTNVIHPSIHQSLLILHSKLGEGLEPRFTLEFIIGAGIARKMSTLEHSHQWTIYSSQNLSSLSGLGVNQV